METLLTLFKDFTEYSKANPILAGLVGLFGMSVVTFVLVKLPSRILQFTIKHCTTTLTFNNSNVGLGLENFSAFSAWFYSIPWSKRLRSYAIDGVYTRFNDFGTTIGVGLGKHFFLWEGWPFWLYRENMQQQGGAYQIHVQISVTMLGRSRARLERFIEAFRYQPPADKVGVYAFTSKQWERIADVAKRPLASVVAEAKMKEHLIQKITEWQSQKAWFQEHGLPYKLTIVLHGPPGTGKTTWIKALASHLHRNLAVVNLSQMSDALLEQALGTVPTNAIVAIEDFDSASASHRRLGSKKSKLMKRVQPSTDNSDAPAIAGHDENTTKADVSLKGLFDTLTPSGLYNALDGLVTLDDTIVFMTTNHLEVMDDALLRAGRVDHIVYVGPLKDPEIREYMAFMYPGYQSSFDGTYDDMLGCDLQALYFEHREDPEGFESALSRRTSSTERPFLIANI